ncbi:MAG: ABC transporter permease [Bacteroidetes bacterium]|nr:ABC transporter permease [Bacteroidota bacterium]
MRIIYKLLVKDIVRFVNDKTALLLTFLVPAILIIIFGNIFSGNGGFPGVHVIFVNNSKSELAKTLETKLDSSEAIILVKNITDTESGKVINFTVGRAVEEIKKGKISAAIIFPDDFFSDTSKSVKIKFFYDPKDQIESSIVQGSVQQAIMSSMPDVLPVLMQRKIESSIGYKKVKKFKEEMSGVVSEYLNVPVDSIYKKEDSLKLFSTAGANTNNFLSKLINIENSQVVGAEVKNPGVTRIVGGWAMMFLLFSLTGAATSLFEEKQEGSLKRLLCMPISRGNILWSKYIYSVLIGIIQLFVLFLFAYFLFDVEIFSNFFNLIIVILASAAAAVSFGMLITALSSSIAQANGIATLLIMIMSAIGGAWFPVSILPDWMQSISKLTITYWSVEAFLQVLWRGGDLTSISLNLIILLSIAVIVNTYAIFLFRKGKIF